MRSECEDWLKPKVLIDANCYVSKLMGKRLSNLTQPFEDGVAIAVYSDEALSELLDVTCRRKFENKFELLDVAKLVHTICNTYRFYDVPPEYTVKFNQCRDKKDNYLLALAVYSDADYLVTGDEDLLVLRIIGRCQIIPSNVFISTMKNLEY